jgi:hypothetical protein
LWKMHMVIRKFHLYRSAVFVVCYWAKSFYQFCDGKKDITKMYCHSQQLNQQ